MLPFLTIAVMASYGAMDEFLQTFFGRSADLRDFYANMAGAITALVLLTFFTFWPASLVITATIILTITAPSKIPLAIVLPKLNIIFHLFTYAVFTFLWTGLLKRHFSIVPPGIKWLALTVALPILLLIIDKAISFFAGKEIVKASVISSLAAIVIVTTTLLLTAIVKQKLSEKT